MTTRTSRAIFIPLIDNVGTTAAPGEMFINSAQNVLYWKDSNGQIRALGGGGGGGGGGGTGGTGNFDDVYISGTLQVDGVTLFGSEVNFNLVKVYGVRDPQGDDEAVNLRTLNDKIQAFTQQISLLAPVLNDSNKALFQETPGQWAYTSNLAVTEDLVSTTPYGGPSAKVQFNASTSWFKTIYDKCKPIAVKANTQVVFQGFAAMTSGLKCIKIRFFNQDTATQVGDVTINIDTWTKVDGTLTPLFSGTTVALWKRFQVRFSPSTDMNVTARVELCKNDGSVTGSGESSSLFMNIGGFQFETNTQSTDYNKTTNIENFGRYSLLIPGAVHKKGTRPVIVLEKQIAIGQFSEVETGYFIENGNGNIEIQYPEEVNLVDGRVIIK